MMARKLSTSELREAVWSMDYIDKMSLLTLSVLGHDPAPIDGVIGLVELVVRLSMHFPTDRKFRIADRLRDASDRVERGEDAHCGVKVSEGEG
jgi:hypothetical protein